MNNEKKTVDETKVDSTINEILEIVRIAKSVRGTTEPYEDKTRPIIASKNYGEEVKILHYTH